jgi:glycogen operon protein
VHVREGRTLVAVPAVADAVAVCLVDGDGRGEQRLALERDGELWCAELGPLANGTRYGLRCTRAGVSTPLLCDPWARGVEEHEGRPVAVVVEGAFAWHEDAPPDHAWSDSVLYETHVRGATMRHPEIEPALRGTYLGLASEPFLAHLVALGVTAVELLPVHAFHTDARLRALGLVNYWGYATVGFFAPHAAYATDGRAVTAAVEVREMVRRLHAAGIEVLLDVVYNHTAEGDEDGETLTFRGLDDAGWYRRGSDGRYEDVTGCGATLDVRRPLARELVLESLRFWAEEVHVDGFRFDLAPALGRDPDGFDPSSPLLTAIAQDPMLSRRKLVAEPWDLGPGGYRLGGFGRPWAEWNDRFRDDVRDFWRGTAHGPGALAQRLAGSADVLGTRAPLASVNVVTTHDGFTLTDLVSYARKHNLANGEQGRDGRDDNRSESHGVEGATDDPAVRGVRERQRRNLLATLLLAHGVPQLLGGDERGRTQEGNNNAYCQDGPLSWVDWSSHDEDAAALTAFVRRCLALRRRHPVLRAARPLTGMPVPPDELPDAVWLDGAGGEMGLDDWHDPARRLLGLYLHEGGRRPHGLVIWLHAGDADAEVRLPAALAGTAAVPLLDTRTEDGSPTPATAPFGPWRLQGRCVLVLELAWQP